MFKIIICQSIILDIITLQLTIPNVINLYITMVVQFSFSTLHIIIFVPWHHHPQHNHPAPIVCNIVILHSSSATLSSLISPAFHIVLLH